jgi:hypothetical protein
MLSITGLVAGKPGVAHPVSLRRCNWYDLAVMWLLVLLTSLAMARAVLDAGMVVPRWWIAA